MKSLIDDYPLLVLPNLAKAIGLNEAIFLQQLHYWLNRSNHNFDGQPWVYNTAADWAEQFPFWCEKTIRRVIDKLKKQNLIETTPRFNKKNYDKTNWFTINYQSVEKLDSQFGQKASGQSVHSVSKASGQSVQIHVDNLSRPIPETTRDSKTPAAKKTQPVHTVKKQQSPHHWFIAWWCHAYQQVVDQKYAITKKDAGQVANLLKRLPLEEVTARACAYLALSPEKRFPRGAPTLGGLLCQINEVASGFDDQLEQRFIDNGLLPDFAKNSILIDFQPWKKMNESPTAA